MNSERRRYYRIDDRVGLSLVPIDRDAEPAALAAFSELSQRVGLINEIHAIRDKFLPEQRQLQNKFPTVAAYMGMLDRQIECLAHAVKDQEPMPQIADTDISLSAQGLSLVSALESAVGDLFEVRLVLFPERSRLLALARVVDLADARLALEFCNIRAADREAIIRHVHALQISRLREDPNEPAESGG